MRSMDVGLGWDGVEAGVRQQHRYCPFVVAMKRRLGVGIKVAMDGNS